MRNIYLIRHGCPDFPNGKKMCLGRTDLPLGPLGRLQAAVLGLLPELKGLPVYASPLLRAVQTAKAISSEMKILPGSEELDMGLWDGLCFDEIKMRYPELYEARGKDRSLLPPLAETKEHGKRRFWSALQELLCETSGDLIIVTHNALIQALLDLSGPVPYGSITTVRTDGSSLRVVNTGRVPCPAMTTTLSGVLMDTLMPEKVVKHCKKTAEVAIRIAAHTDLNQELIRYSALLHDLARKEPSHAERGGAYLEALGYSVLADVIRQHHDHTGERLDEAAIVYLADKLVLEDREVTLEERFFVSGQKCSTAEQRAAHDKRYQAALRIQNLLAES